MSSKIRSLWRVLGVFIALLLVGLVAAPFASANTLWPDPNILQLNNVTACTNTPGSAMCNNGAPFLLSQITSWFAIIGSAGGYVVKNDLGNLGSFSITLNVTQTGNYDPTFECHHGTSTFTSCLVSGPNLTALQIQGGGDTAGRFGTPGNVTVAPGLVTYTWSGGAFPSGTCPGGGSGCFLLTYASWNNTPQVVPEPATLFLFGTGLLGVAALKRRLQSRRG